MRLLSTTIRGLSRSPGFTLVTVTTLALGIGASVAIYTLLDRVVLDPLPYPQADRLVEVTNQVPGVGPDAVWNTSTAQFVQFTDQAESFDAVALYRGEGANIETPEGPQRASGMLVTAGLFPLLGIGAEHGRVITPADDQPGGPDVVVLSHGFWSRQFGANPDVVGQALSINGSPFEVIGVLEADAGVPGYSADNMPSYWIPLRVDPNGSFGNSHIFPMIARLAEGRNPVMAETELERITAQLPERFPNAYSQRFFDQYGFRSQVTPLKEAIIGNTAQTIWILFGAVTLVMIIAAANVANLFIVRMEGQRQELAVRTALGAGSWHVIRHVLSESLALSAAGGVLALVVGWWGIPALVALAPASIPRLDGLGLDAGSVLFTAALSLFVGLGITAYPLFQYFRHGRETLVMGDRRGTAGRERQRLRAGLVVGQVALALTLVAGAGLLLESMRKLNQIQPGFESEGVLTAGLFATPSRYADDVALWGAYRQIMERVRAIPGVEAVGMTLDLPALGNFGCTVQGFEDSDMYQRVRDAGMTTCAGQEPTSPGYFEAAGIPVLQGRTFTDQDNDEPTRAAVVVSKAFADRFWPGEDPIGKGIAPSGRNSPPFYYVVGVVGDVPAASLDGDPAVAVYYPIVNAPVENGWDYWYPSSMNLVVRTSLQDPVALAPALRRAVAEVDPTIPVANLNSMQQIVSDSIGRFRFTSLLLGVAACAALLLAGIGLYGVVSYVVSRRTREIGIRIAVGAEPAAVGRQVASGALLLIGSGLALGLVAAFLATRAMTGLLYGVEPTHPVAFVIAAATLGLVGMLAAWIPARRASRVDPVVALRNE